LHPSQAGVPAGPVPLQNPKRIITMYSENHKKLVLALSQKYGTEQLLNAAIHITAGLAADLGPEPLRLLDYQNRRAALAARISLFPNIVLAAKNGGHLRRFKREARAAGLCVNAFTESMLGRSAEEQMRQTCEADPDTLDFIAVAVFGEARLIDPLTKRFSLWCDHA